MSIRVSRVEKGMKAPDFCLPDQEGNMHSLADFKGKKIALFFYPKDNTPTCTVEACNLRDNYSLLKRKGIAVIGMSKDPVKSHLKFVKKFSLPFPLLSDEEGNVLSAYDVYGEKILYGRKYMGIYRTTFLIDEKGIILEVITDVNSKDHAQQIMDLLKK
ncbi:MAG: thioredoxin-dependent thiol peroxidase [Bacteroidetes bacterium]|nr:thioredoxin-dependent thiol peroxidase [Bacteroidota bacterium]MBL0064342.1 thioredoxin-dependent thiol peroxidase [Bacteroidota bacterium]